MGGRQDAAVALAQELYKGGTTTTLEAVLSAESLTDIESRLQYLESSEDAHAKVFERLAVDRQDLNDRLAVLEADRKKAMEAEQRLTALKADIDAKVASQQDEIQQLNAAIERAEARAQARAEAAAQTASAPIAISNVPIKAAPAPNAQAQAAVDAALSQVGKPYQWGAAGPNSYDCSGLTMWSWAHAGVSLPHSSSSQYGATVRVAQGDWEPGDLLFFGSPIHHVGMYIGNGQMVEAPYTGQYVRVVSASRSDLVGAGRPGV
jgi:cell wall-associated NlpC family hydrolase